MDKIVENIWYNDIEKLIEEGKQGNKIIWERDGHHSIDDLQIVLEFENAGFEHAIYNYKGKYEDKAIKVEFEYKKDKAINLI